MRRSIESTRKRGFGRALIAATVGAVALSATVVPALADTVVYGYPPPVTVYTPAPAYTYTYTEPVYPPTYTYVRERGPGVYVDTPVLNFGIGFH
jgi:hypothetical protein